MAKKKYEVILFSFLMSMFMSGFMSFIITYINLGFIDNFIFLWLNAYWKAFIIAFPTIFIIVPQVRKLTQLLMDLF